MSLRERRERHIISSPQDVNEERLFRTPENWQDEGGLSWTPDIDDFMHRATRKVTPDLDEFVDHKGELISNIGKERRIWLLSKRAWEAIKPS